MWVNRDSLASIKTRVNMIQHERLLTYDNQVGRLHCLMPGWADATVSFMLSGGYNVTDTISKVQLDSNHQQLKILSIYIDMKVHWKFLSIGYKGILVA